MNSKLNLIYIYFLLGSILTLSLIGCADSGTVSGNTTPTPTTSTTGSVTLKSAPYTVGRAASVNYAPQYVIFDPSADITADTAALTDFKFCITQLKLTADPSNDATSGVIGSAPVGAIQAIVGLVDVSDPTTDTNWATLDIPVGFMLSELAVEVHTDPENCSQAPYSLSYNGTQLTQDLEFKFTFFPSVQLDPNDILNLSLSKIAGTFQAADTAGQLDNQNITAYIEGLSEVGTEE
ncbi:MAG: hypothetical protein OEY59_11770 [Deltaproteobacteria bacterium]|nr:hypothetical protein [Deltaproteobacteria bacterium]